MWVCGAIGHMCVPGSTSEFDLFISIDGEMWWNNVGAFICVLIEINTLPKYFHFVTFFSASWCLLTLVAPSCISIKRRKMLFRNKKTVQYFLFCGGVSGHRKRQLLFSKQFFLLCHGDIQKYFKMALGNSWYLFRYERHLAALLSTPYRERNLTLILYKTGFTYY